LLLASVLTLLAVGLVRADSDDATARHPFDDVAKWEKIFDDPRRAEWQQPAAIVRALALKPGMVVADVGAGTGYFERALSDAVGPRGSVLAVEVEPNLVTHLRARAEREGTANVIPILGSTADPRLPAGRVDRILYVDTYHHLDDRVDYFRRLLGALAPGGLVVVVDWKKEKSAIGPPLDHRLAREQVLREMEQAGYRVVDTDVTLPEQYVLVFAPL
jgi:predicted methyltransferase